MSALLPHAYASPFVTLNAVAAAFIAVVVVGMLIVTIINHFDPPGGPGPFSPC